MPIYEYECKNCNTRFEKLQSITADPLTECANCGGGPIRRVLHPVGIIFKGSGWYITDNRKPNSESSSSSSGGSSASSSSSSSESSAASKEAKPEKPSGGASGD